VATAGPSSLSGQLAVPAGTPKSPRALAWERFRRKKLAMASLCIIVTFYVCGILAAVLAPHSYREQNLDNTEQAAWLSQPYCAVISMVDSTYRPPKVAPSTDHLLGTDRAGRDLLSRILFGMRTSVIVSLASILTGSVFLGVTLGALSGFLGGKVDSVIMRVGEVFLAFPGLLLVILISATVRDRVQTWAENFELTTGFKGLVESGFIDYVVVFGAMSVFGWVGVARVIRGQILQVREMDYITAAIALGGTTRRIILTHVLPNTTNIIIYMLSIGLGAAIGSELILSWMGVGIKTPTPSLGVMIYESQGQTAFLDQISCRKPPLFLAPVLLVTLMTFAFALLGDGLIDALNPRSRDSVSGAKDAALE